jgi:hypothetical protein
VILAGQQVEVTLNKRKLVGVVEDYDMVNVKYLVTVQGDRKLWVVGEKVRELNADELEAQ